MTAEHEPLSVLVQTKLLPSDRARLRRMVAERQAGGQDVTESSVARELLREGMRAYREDRGKGEH